MWVQYLLIYTIFQAFANIRRQVSTNLDHPFGQVPQRTNFVENQKKEAGR